MIDIEAARRLVRAFGDRSDGAALKSRDLVLLLLEQTPTPFSRRQFRPGHITCTGLVLDPAGDRLLLVHHRRLDRWLLPGGHVEDSDVDLASAARREVVEETGAVLRPGGTILAGIDVHGIPAHEAEPYHLHHDLVFAFRSDASEIAISEESRSVAWVTPGQFDAYNVPDNVRRAWMRVQLLQNSDS